MLKAPNGAPYPPPDTIDARSFYHPEKSGRQKRIRYPEENAREMGRPTRYKKSYALQVRTLAGKRWTNGDICEFLGIGETTFFDWREKHFEFAEAIRLARENLEDSIEQSLASRALGFSVRETHISNYQGNITKTKFTKHYPPDVGAAKFWLANQRRAKWNIDNPGEGHEVKDDTPLTEGEMLDIDRVLGDCIDEH